MLDTMQNAVALAIVAGTLMNFGKRAFLVMEEEINPILAFVFALLLTATIAVAFSRVVKMGVF